MARGADMSRWQSIIDSLFTDLETETPGVEGFRINIDHKMAEHERIVHRSHNRSRLPKLRNTVSKISKRRCVSL